MLIALLLALANTDGELIETISGAYLAANVVYHCGVLTSGKAGGISLVISLFFLLFMALPSYIQISAGTFPNGARFATSEITASYIILCLAQIAYIGGNVIASRSRIGNPNSITMAKTIGYSGISIFVIIKVVLVASVVLVAAVSPRSLIIHRFDSLGSELDDGMRQQMAAMLRSLALLNAIICIQVRKGAFDGAARKMPGYLITCVIGILILTHYPPALSRFQLLGAILAISASLVNYFSPVTKLIASASAVFFLLTIFPTIKALGDGRGIAALRPTYSQTSKYLTESFDLDPFSQVTNTYKYMQTNGPRSGENLLGVVLFFIPRGVWQDKPVHSGEVVSTALGYEFTNVSNPLPSEGYIAFSYVGVFVIMYSLGMAVRLLERYVGNVRKRSGVHVVYFIYALSVGFGIIGMRGAINAVAPMFLTSFYVCGLVIAINRIRRPNAAISSKGVITRSIVSRI